MWRVWVDSGWLSGAEVVLGLKKDATHHAKIDVNSTSRMARALMTLGMFAGIAAALLLFVVSVFVVKFFAIAFIVIVIPFIFLWSLAMSITVAILSKTTKVIFGDRFDEETRTALAQRLKALPLQAQLGA